VSNINLLRLCMAGLAVWAIAAVNVRNENRFLLT
jgi:hypothetical protein